MAPTKYIVLVDHTHEGLCAYDFSEEYYEDAISTYLTWKDEYHLETRLIVVDKELTDNEVRIAEKIGVL